MTSRARIPVATLLLIALQLGAAVAVFLRPELVDHLGFRPREPWGLPLMGSILLHANLFHLLGNMLFLAAAGPPLEFTIGPAKTVLVFVVAGIVGNLAHVALAGASSTNLALMGASGAIAGLVMVASVRFFSVRVPLAPRVSVTVPMVVGLWLALQVVGAFFVLGDIPGGVSYWAHLGGALAGLLLALLLRLPAADKLAFGHEVLDRINQMGPSAALVVAEQHLKEHPGDVRAKVALAEAHRDLGHAREESELLIQVLGSSDHESRVRAALRLGEIGGLQRWPSMRRCRLADEWRESEPEAAEVLLRSVAQEMDDPQRPQALLALASIDPDFAQTLLRDYPMDDATSTARARGLLP
ncbi:MAG: rhomboid family intramembrane serine protease [Chthonomonas sp.]|nr:rhomboid family intramembrane serine protease [Chthonomonas sp.]